jgi:hypothetical protein
MTFFDYVEDDIIYCEMCNSRATDIHHLTKQSKFGSKKERDYIENLCGLCRDCHIKAESDSMFNCFARIKHLENVCHQIYAKIEYQKIYENKRRRTK